MGLLEFNKLPINTLVGADWKTFKAITAGREIDAAYKGKYRLTKAVCRLLSPLASLQDRRYEKLLANQPLEHDPVFILGHWRSGNLMDMRVNIAGVEWKNPVTVASGTFGSGEEFSEFVDLNKLGAVTTKGVANVPWSGNPTPRVAEVYGGMMNAIGLQNPGIDLFCKRAVKED